MRKYMRTISVIVPAYKVEPYINRCVDSILAQTYRDFELILVDDGSPDNCGKICDEYAKQDSRVHVIHQENKGLSAARNAGIRLAKGEYIARLDDDDVCYPTRLEKQIEYLDKNRDVVLVGTHIDLLKNGKYIAKEKAPINEKNEIKFSLPFGNYLIAHSSFMMRKEVLIKNNIVYEKFVQTPDYNMLCNMSRVGDLYCLDEPLCAWRIHEAQSTQIRTRKMKQYEDDLTKHDHIEKLPINEVLKEDMLKVVGRKLKTFKDFELIKSVLFSYAKECGVKDNYYKSDCVKYIYNDLIKRQRYCIPSLYHYIRDGLGDIRWLFSRPGIGYIIRCIFSMNKEWFGETEAY